MPPKRTAGQSAPKTPKAPKAPKATKTTKTTKVTKVTKATKTTRAKRTPLPQAPGTMICCLVVGCDSKFSTKPEATRHLLAEHNTVLHGADSDNANSRTSVTESGQQIGALACPFQGCLGEFLTLKAWEDHVEAVHKEEYVAYILLAMNEQAPSY